jgi:hypothetical protein
MRTVIASSTCRTAASLRPACFGATRRTVLGFFQSWLQTYLVKGRGFTEAALVLFGSLGSTTITGRRVVCGLLGKPWTRKLYPRRLFITELSQQTRRQGLCVVDGAPGVRLRSI